MGAAVGRGRLGAGTDAPGTGESFRTIIESGGVRIEEILSSDRPDPVAYDQAGHEWVVVLEGAAQLEVGPGRYDLGPGEWLFLPAGTVHRVTAARRGTRWLAVHLPRVDRAEPERDG